VTYDGDLAVAHAPMSVTLVFEDDLDVSRGDLIAAGAVNASSTFVADVVWMDERPLVPGRRYLLKHLTRTVGAEFDGGAALNDIVRLIVTAAQPLVFDGYRANRTTGSFIVIDPATNFTCGAGMIARAVSAPRADRTYRPLAERLAALARSASSDADAAEAVRRVLEETLT
jgi:sulfate adenylyltransferase subunit 1 (EFTu-like GTPase family)